MNEAVMKFRQELNDSVELQEKIKAGTDLVELGKENGHDFSEEDVQAAYEELQGPEEGLTEFELEAVTGGQHHQGID
jgi:predicted ribosomally synthesized peptide with nif11-like leader